MPFEQKKIHISKYRAFLDPNTRFGQRNIFGNRVQSNPDGKKVAALYIAETFTKEGASIFVSDGSSTFFVCSAMAWKSFAFEREFHLLTNNLGIATELEAAPYNPQPKVKIDILGGRFDPSLYATLPTQHDATIKKKIQDVSLSVVSVRQLFVDEGPTSPEPDSRRVKEYIFQSASDLVIPLDWNKLADAEPESGKLVFKRREWRQILCNQERRITIVCDQPLDRPDTANPFKIGMQLDSDGFAKGSPTWRSGTDYDRYCWQVFQFSHLPHVTFVEVEGYEP